MNILQILDACSEFIFGESFNSLERDCPEDSQKFMSSFSYAQQGVGKRVMLGKLDFLIRDSQFWDSCVFIREYTLKHIDRAIMYSEGNKSYGGQRRYILAHELVKTTTSRAVLCDQLLNMVFAGRDTPAVALTSVFFCVARSPQTWRKIRDEIKGLKDEELTFDRLKTLRYVQSVIKEGEKYAVQTDKLHSFFANADKQCDFTHQSLILPGHALRLLSYLLAEAPTARVLSTFIQVTQSASIYILFTALRSIRPTHKASGRSGGSRLIQYGNTFHLEGDLVTAQRSNLHYFG